MTTDIKLTYDECYQMVKLYVAGKLFEEKVHAVNYQDAKETALARNPKAKVVSVNPTFKDD